MQQVILMVLKFGSFPAKRVKIHKIRVHRSSKGNFNFTE